MACAGVPDTVEEAGDKEIAFYFRGSPLPGERSRPRHTELHREHRIRGRPRVGSELYGRRSRRSCPAGIMCGNRFCMFAII